MASQVGGLNIGGLCTIDVGPTGKPPVNSLVLPLTPDQSLAHNMRTTVTQTLSGIFVDRFGAGIPTLTLSGTTGWASPYGKFNNTQVKGNTAARHLYKDIILYYQTQQMNKPNSQTMSIYYDVTGDAWVVEPYGTPQFQRTKDSPFLLMFQLQFVILRDLMNGTPVSANTNSSSSTKSNVGSKVVDQVVQTFQTKKSAQQYASTQTGTASISTTAKKTKPNIIYVVQSGNTLWTIAEQYLPRNATNTQVQNLVNQITSLNHLSNPNLIFVNQKLQIPS